MLLEKREIGMRGNKIPSNMTRIRCSRIYFITIETKQIKSYIEKYRYVFRFDRHKVENAK